MKYMLMMHVGREDGTEVLSWAPQDIKNMIEFQHAFDRELEESGEMVFNQSHEAASTNCSSSASVRVFFS